jgi:hypothetical protein
MSSQNSVRKKSFGGTFTFSNCHIIGLDTVGLVFLVSAYNNALIQHVYKFGKEHIRLPVPVQTHLYPGTNHNCTHGKVKYSACTATLIPVIILVSGQDLNVPGPEEIRGCNAVSLLELYGTSPRIIYGFYVSWFIK